MREEPAFGGDSAVRMRNSGVAGSSKDAASSSQEFQQSIAESTSSETPPPQTLEQLQTERRLMNRLGFIEKVPPKSIDHRYFRIRPSTPPLRLYAERLIARAAGLSQSCRFSLTRRAGFTSRSRNCERSVHRRSESMSLTYCSKGSGPSS